MPITRPLARFGVFELDLSTGELSKNGRRVRLQEQPFRLLRLLVEQPGLAVPRERLKDTLWPADTFVDFDHGLNAAVAKLRQALGDSAENPRFIETMARCGYRFIAPVELVGGTSNGTASRSTAPEFTARRIALSGSGTEQFKHLGAKDGTQKKGFLVQHGTTESGERPSIRPIGTHRTRFVTVPLLRIGLSVVLVIIGVAWSLWPRRGEPPNTRIQSLAVLPLENLSGNAEQDYFADGMTAELITELAKIPSLRVTSRTSAMRYKGSTKSVKQIARELDVDALVEGEVVQSGHRVRVTVKLIQTATDKHLWAEAFERDLHDVLELQGEVARSIVNTFRTTLRPAERARLTGYHRVNPEAYDCYLKGRFFWNKRTEPGLKKSVQYFELAIEKDPAYALAYSGLADSYNVMGGLGFLLPKDAFLKAKVAANNALKIDSTLGEAHTVLGDVMYELEWNWRAAEAEFERATELSPGNATAHQRYSLFLMKIGRPEDSLAEIYRALALDPLSLSINASVGWRLLWARRYDDAINQFQKTLEMEPDFGSIHMYLGWAYEAKGDLQKAVYELRKLAPSDAGSEALASLGHAYARAGYTRQAQHVLKQLEERSKRAHVAAYHMATVYAGLGERDRAFEFLAKSCSNRDTELLSLKVDLELDNLRADARFENLLRCVGLMQ